MVHRMKERPRLVHRSSSDANPDSSFFRLWSTPSVEKRGSSYEQEEAFGVPLVDNDPDPFLLELRDCLRLSTATGVRDSLYY